MSLLSGLGKLAGGALGKIKGVALHAIPGGGIIEGATKIAGRIGRKNLKRIAAGAVLTGVGGAAIMSAHPTMKTTGRRVGVHGLAGMGGRRRRINPGNPKAMRRAIRRVEMGARLYHKMFGIRHGKIKGAPNVHVKTHHRRAA